MTAFSALGTLSINSSFSVTSIRRRPWALTRLTQTLIMSAIAFVVGWLINVYLMAIRYEGFQVPAGTPNIVVVRDGTQRRGCEPGQPSSRRFVPAHDAKPSDNVGDCVT